MFPLAFVAGWLQGHWGGFISRNYVVWPTFFLMNVFIALKGSHFWFYILYTEMTLQTSECQCDSFWAWTALHVTKPVIFTYHRPDMTKLLLDKNYNTVSSWHNSVEHFLRWHFIAQKPIMFTIAMPMTQNSVREDVKCRQFIALLCYWWDIGLSGWCQIEIDKKFKRQ